MEELQEIWNSELVQEVFVPLIAVLLQGVVTKILNTLRSMEAKGGSKGKLASSVMNAVETALPTETQEKRTTEDEARSEILSVRATYEEKANADPDLDNLDLPAVPLPDSADDLLRKGEASPGEGDGPLDGANRSGSGNP